MDGEDLRSVRDDFALYKAPIYLIFLPLGMLQVRLDPGLGQAALLQHLGALLRTTILPMYNRASLFIGIEGHCE